MAASAIVLGASGYAGGEVLRLLARHPAIEVVAASAASRAGSAATEVLPHLHGLSELELGPLQEVASVEADVCISCLPHGAFPEHLAGVRADVYVDLGDDFRADPDWVYGLPELGRVPAPKRIANPGCYPTAALLCLAPFFRSGFAGAPVVIDAISGVSGAGRSAKDSLLFANLDGGVSAYGSTDHKHVAEIERGLGRAAATDVLVSFTPHLAPMSRGLLITARVPLDDDSLTSEGALELLRDAYSEEPFVHVLEGWPATKAVAGTNLAHVSARVDDRTGYLVCSAAIDNLGKGAAGQAVQNVNLALGLEETTGLEAIAVWP